MADPNHILPAWADELTTGYESGACSQFILYGNVNDRRLVGAGDSRRLGSLREFLLDTLLVPFDVVLSFDLGNGVRVEKGGEILAKWPQLKGLPELPRQPRPAVELLTHYFRFVANLGRLGQDAPQVACIVQAAELLLPHPQDGGSAETSTLALLVREWGSDALITRHAVASLLVCENVSDLHPLLANNLHAARVKIPLPEEGEIAALLVQLQPDCPLPLQPYAADFPALARQLVGATLGAVEQMLKRLQYRQEVLTAEALVSLKKSMVEEEYGGLVTFIESHKTLDAIHGNEMIKAWLRQDVALWQRGDLRALPMGYLLCGPVGTGKTYFVDCLAGEAGVPVVKLKNFRDKWVGSTEGNLEKIFRLLHALGRCIVFVDEADQALGRRTASSGDSGVSGRVYSMLAEEMSDTDNRGRIVWILASSRPDLIEVDLKRPGRIDVKIPLFPALSAGEGFGLIQALCRRLELTIPDTALAALEPAIPLWLTPGAAEALAVKVYRLARTAGLDEVEALRRTLASYQVPVPHDVMAFQIDLAVREASDLDFVPLALRVNPAAPPVGDPTV
ncbi:MAG: hypothetical protein A2091_07200 [Desulfuromonadales bacterium GWD2_61_12]|nr:MAG: hypothetical protein A2005_01850 [Desulfuromonadales bacterium GWC2_61_20]OGR33295.1 MAG: hypothetical protein A2091_07200 [Desulfuromonadales bacterium GWD2_61_12]HAD04337.1 hypothetical protein [Desulfuromonas sp.]HBT83369.1 hypothetical protein [Desulfuromonas sp.]